MSDDETVSDAGTTADNGAASPAERWLTLVLRIGGVMMALAFLAVVMPRHCMATTHEWLGLAELPDGPIVEYLARSLSAFYAMHGALFLMVSTDVRRYGPVITLLAVLGVALGIGLIAIDIAAGLPLYWIAIEGPFVTDASALILVLRRAAKTQ
jgi:hypothetical protein